MARVNKEQIIGYQLMAQTYHNWATATEPGTLMAVYYQRKAATAATKARELLLQHMGEYRA